MKNKLLRRTLSGTLAVMMLASMTTAVQVSGTFSLSASAVVDQAYTIDSGACGEFAAYTLDSSGKLTLSGQGAVNESAFAAGNYEYANSIKSIEFAAGSEITDIGANAFCGLANLAAVTVSETVASIADSAFGECAALTEVNIASAFVKLHPDAFRDCPAIETLAFTAFDGATIQGALYGLPETAQVTMQPFSKLYTPAQKYLYGPAVAYDVYRPAYAHAILYWEDTEAILEAAAAEGVSISDSKEKLEWITNDNIGTYFTDAQSSIVGTMQGDGSFADPLQIWDAANWRYLDYLARLGKLAGSYYGWDRGTNVKLMADITLSDKDGTFTTIGGEKHKEVHNSGYAYVGNFDGNCHTITLDVSDSIDDGGEGFGLFAKTDGAYIKNLHVSGRLVSSRVYTGLIIGKSSTDWIYNCSSDAELVLKGGGDRLSGSFVGNAYHTSLENCHFTGKILGGDDITGVGGFVGYMNGSNASGRTMKNCYFAPSEIGVSSTNSAMLYRPYYGSYSGWVGYETIENNFYNAEALKLAGENMGDLDQGQSDAEGIDALNETEFWEDGEITMPQATVSADPGTRTFVYTGGEHRIFMDLQADGYNGDGSILARGSSFPYMPGYAKDGIAYYKVNDGAWSATPPVATEVGEYTVYYCAVGDAYHSTSDIQSIEVSIVEPQELPGSGTAADPYTISNDLEWSIFCDMRDTKDKYFKLVNDIVVSENRQSKRGPQHPLEFNGNFDGDGHTITLYYVSRGTSDSLFGKLIGVWNYDTSSYDPVYIKNLTVDGVMYGSSGENSPIAYEITHNATVSNVINNMTIVHIGAGGDRAVSGIVNTGSISGGVHFYNCKVNGKFSAMGGNKTFAGLTSMNDFWQSGTDFLVKDCYVDPTCEDINVSDGNYVIMGNYKEDKVTIENTFFGQSILGIIPVDAETGETTNTQGISDENGLDALYETGYWADGNPTMPKATITKKAPDTYTVVYYEPEEPEIDPETGEPIEQEPTRYPLLAEPAEAEGGTVWYRFNGSEWTTDIPAVTDIGMYYVEYKAVGDILHRDSDPERAIVSVVPEWAIPTGLTIGTIRIPYESYGAFASDTNAQIRVEWDDIAVNTIRFTLGVITPDGKMGTYFEGAPVDNDSWYELGGDKPAARFFVGLLGEDDEQVFENGTVNGAKYGDTVYVYATGVLNYEGNLLESVPSISVDFAAGASNVGKTFPVNEEGMSNDSGIENEVIVLGDKAVIDCLASGGKAPYQFEVTYKKSGTSKYYTAQAFSAKNIATFTPGSATSYDIHIVAKDSEGNTAEKDLKVDVKKVLANFSKMSEETIVFGESVIIEADSEGGIEPREYRVTYKADGSDEETVVQDYDANDRITVTPASAGLYTVKVSVKDSRDVVVSKIFSLTVNKPLANNSTISSELILLGDSVTVNAASEGGLEPVEYEISVKTSDGEIIVISDYSDNTTETIRTDVVGDFAFIVNVKDARGTVVTKELPFKVHNTLTNFSEISDTEIVLGESADLTAKVRGGKAPYTYAMCYKPADADEYIMFRDFSDDPQATFTPEADGAYNVVVLVKDSFDVVADKEFNVQVNKKLKNISTVSAKKIVLGDTVTVNALAEGGKGDYQYKVSYKKATSTNYSVVQGYSDNAVIEVKPGAAVEYNIRVAIRDGRGVVVTKIFTINVYKVLENKASISAEIITLGDTVTVNADAAGGKAPYKYEVTYKKSTSENYSKAQAYSTKNEITINPTSAVIYDVHVNVKDALGQVVGKDFKVEVCKPLVNTSKVSAEDITLGEALKVTGRATGGKTPYQYEVTYKKATLTKYTTAQAYKTNKSVSIKFGAAVTYNVHVNVKDALGQVVGADFDVQVYKPLEFTAGISADTLVLGQSVTVNAEARNGKAPYQYQLQYKKSTSETYSTAVAYGESGTMTLTPGGASAYDVRVNCRDAMGTVLTQDMTVTVYNTLKNTSTLSATAVTPDKSVTVKCSSTGGLGTKQYKVIYYDPDTKKWVTVQNYSTNANVSLGITKTGFFTVRTYVKDECGTEVTKDITLNVYGVLTNTSTISGVTTKASGNTAPYNGTVTVNCSSTGAKGTPKYEVMYYSYSMKTWFTASSYSAANRVTIKTNVTGNWLVRVKVKDDRNTAVSKDFKFEVHL